MTEVHVSVMKQEVIKWLGLKPGDIAMDATLDGGGHAFLMLQEIYPNGKVLGLEQDEGMIDVLKKRVADESESDPKKKLLWQNLLIKHANFRNIENILKESKFAKPKGIFFDLGVSRWHFMESKHGFSFQDREAILDMRMGSTTDKVTAADVLNSYPEIELARIFYEYGEERNSRKIAKLIVTIRKNKRFTRVEDLLDIFPFKKARTHPATKIFQALRIEVNDELGALKTGLADAWRILENGGRIVVLSYHSLEDRIVKRFFKEKHLLKEGELLTKKPLIPSKDEIILNPSSRSAKLRAIYKK